MRANHLQTSFLSGEWGKLAQGRMDDPRYRAAMAVCHNSIPIQEGAVVRRPGLGRIGHTRNGAPAVIKSFSFTEDASLSVEFTDGAIRFSEGARFVQDLEADVVSITAGVVTTAADHELTSGDHIEFGTSTIADTILLASLLRSQFRVEVLTATTFRIFEVLSGQPSTLTATPDAAVINRIHEISSAYTEDTLAGIRTVQAEDDMVLLNRQIAPNVLTLDGGGEDGIAFSLAAADIKDGPYLDPVTGSLATPSGTTGIITLTLSFSAYEATRAYSVGDFVSDAGVGYRSLTDQNVGNTPASSPTDWETASPGRAVGPDGFVGSDVGRLVRIFSGGSAWSWGKITALSNAGVIDPDAPGTTKLGDMNNAGGVAAAFDGIFVPTGSSSYARNTASLTGWVGLGLPAPSNVQSVVCYYASTEGGSAFKRAQVYGHTSAPNGTGDNGTIIGTLESPPAGTFTVDCDPSSNWDYVWVRFIANGTSNIQTSEVQFFNSSGSPGSAAEVQVLGPALVNTAAATWRLGVYSDTTGWPTCGCYHQGRLFLGGAVENRWDASKANDIYNFEPTAADGALADNNAISYVFNATDRNNIFWMRPSQQGVVCGTQGGEWVIKASENNNNLTPTSAQAHRVTKYECADAEPAVSGLSTVFIQRHRRRTIEFISDIYSGKWFGPDLNEFAKQVTKTGFQELASIEELAPVVWARRTDGKLVGVTYRRVSMYSAEPPKFLAWHQHTLGHGFDVVSISSGPADDTTIDALNLIVKDRGTGIHYVEYMRKLTEEEDEMWAANFLDGSYTPPGAQLTTESSVVVMKLFGFSAYEGQDRDVWACGQDLGRFTVQDGTITVPLTSAFTRQVMAEYTTSATDFGAMACEVRSDVEGEGTDRYTIPVLVGYTFTSQGQMLRPNRPEDTGAREGPGFGKTKRSHTVYALLHNSRGASFGTRFDKLRPMKMVSEGGRVFDVDEAFNGVYTAPLEDTYSYDSQPCWEVSRPYPLSICAFGAAIMSED